MGVADQPDEHTFKINFTGGGVARLRDKVKEKLKEFMGDYTDDTLVEYVIVLLRNGRHKGEARAELNVFLGDDSDSFVSWLWDHLTSNLNLYAQHQEPNLDEVPNITALGNHGNRSDVQHLHTESDGEKSPKVFRSRRKREWKGLVRDAAELPPLRTSEVDNMHVEDNNHHRVVLSRQARSPRPGYHRKRNRPDERCLANEGVSETTTEAPRRLLQFAVRDALGTSRSLNMAIDHPPKVKRLRSVVSTSVNDLSVDDLPRRVQSIARMPNAAAVIKAVAEAAEDVVKYRSTANVFDSMSHSMDVSEGVTEDGFDAAEVQDMRDSHQISMITRSSNYHRRGDYGRGYTRETTMYDSGTGFNYYSASNSEAYNGVNSLETDFPQTGPPSSRVLLKTHNNDREEPAASANAPRYIMNILAGENAWKPPYYQAPREVTAVNDRQHVQEDHVNKAKYVGHLVRENSNPVKVNNGNAKLATQTQSKSQKTLPSIVGSHSSVHPLEDANSRTIFVNNVHFAATKDNLSKHFNKFGEVLKVVIVTDAATGQPKGSAYVEFMRKEEAEHALSSDSTSFMSRILKISKKIVAYSEAAPVVTWPRAARALRFSRASFPRGINGAFRSRPTIKPGARSLQWIRDAQVIPAEAGALVSSNNVPSPTGRGLTYVRIEHQANAMGTN